MDYFGLLLFFFFTVILASLTLLCYSFNFVNLSGTTALKFAIEKVTPDKAREKAAMSDRLQKYLTSDIY